MPREHPAYNPAEYGPNTGPTLPQQDPYSYNNRDPYDHQYDESNHQPGPEVSAPLRSEGRSDPGMSITRYSSANVDRQQG
jgi:hypothetical protein